MEAGFRRGDATLPPRTAGRGAGAAGAVRRRHPPALRRPVGGAGDALLPRRGVPRGGDGAAGSRARDVRSRPTWSTRLGKLMMLKLRRDYKEQQGGKFSLRAFHDAVLAQGTRAVLGAPPPAAERHRRTRRWSSREDMPLYEYECDACGDRFEVIQKFSDGPPEPAAVRQGSGAAADVVAGDSVQGHRLVHHRLRAEGQVGRASSATASGESKTDDERRATRRATRQPAATTDDRSPAATSPPRRRPRRPTRPKTETTAQRGAGTFRSSVSRYCRKGPASSGRFSAKYTSAFRNPSLLPVSCRTPSISHA